MSEREWKFYIGDMLRFAEKVRAYSAGLDRAGFEHNELKYDAILRNLELIGEAATHVPAAVRQKHPVIPWPAKFSVPAGRCSLWPVVLIAS